MAERGGWREWTGNGGKRRFMGVRVGILRAAARQNLKGVKVAEIEKG